MAYADNKQLMIPIGDNPQILNNMACTDNGPFMIFYLAEEFRMAVMSRDKYFLHTM